MLKVFNSWEVAAFLGITPSPPWHGGFSADRLRGWELLRLDAEHARMIRDQVGPGFVHTLGVNGFSIILIACFHKYGYSDGLYIICIIIQKTWWREDFQGESSERIEVFDLLDRGEGPKFERKESSNHQFMRGWLLVSGRVLDVTGGNRRRFYHPRTDDSLPPFSDPGSH